MDGMRPITPATMSMNDMDIPQFGVTLSIDSICGAKQHTKRDTK